MAKRREGVAGGERAVELCYVWVVVHESVPRWKLPPTAGCGKASDNKG